MSDKPGTTILRIDASMRTEGSVTRELTDAHIARQPEARVIPRDLAVAAPPFHDAEWISANFTDAAERTPEQIEALTLSDSLIEELRAADEIVIALPVYNFGVPAALKAWFDLVARAGVTFSYGPDGPVGLLKGKRATILVASGGTRVGSEIDFATPWLRHALGFIGITEVEIVAADAMGSGPERLEQAKERIRLLAA